LPGPRCDGRADLHNRPFRSGRSTGADRNSAGDNLFYRDKRLDEPAGANDRLHHIDDAMTFASLENKSAEHADNQAADIGQTISIASQLP
jgi:hypothetical protein